MAEDVKKTAKLSAIIGYLITAAAIVVLPSVLVSQQDRSNYFWYRIVWSEFLALVMWSYIGGFFLFAQLGGNKVKGLGGILPATGAAIGLYVAISFILIIAFPDPSSKFHIAAQIVLLVCLVLLFAFFQFARAGAVVGTEPIPSDLRTPQQLSMAVKANEDRLFQLLTGQNVSGDVRRLHDALKGLRESIAYSLPYVGSIGTSAEYRTFVAQIEQLCAGLENFRSDAADAASVKSFCDTAERLRSRVSQIASSLKVAAA